VFQRKANRSETPLLRRDCSPRGRLILQWTWTMSPKPWSVISTETET